MPDRRQPDLDRRLGDRRRARLTAATGELAIERRAQARRAAARFNHALLAWHAGPEFFARWQASRRAPSSPTTEKSDDRL